MSIILQELEERYPTPDQGERPVMCTRSERCRYSRTAYMAGAVRQPTELEIDAAALAIYTGTTDMDPKEVASLWPDMNPVTRAQYQRLARLAIMAARTRALL
ncbi:hypothetical protein JS533_001595 [Bifidobacterium amazonense]|uniref:Uncharacterized protein n=1 Tax=Bifidobacterium amazonense TaxID=2809027 RepID=A0ABS9VSC8_9BIFI|nr:hypothetical protein [Bifidobacterium amazonense]MCH9274983.1 hypothetical protein [Bifidobacterium amazonense]